VPVMLLWMLSIWAQLASSTRRTNRTNAFVTISTTDGFDQRTIRLTLIPTHYSINSYPDLYLRSWGFEGSSDNVKWIELDRHEGDPKMNSRSSDRHFHSFDFSRCWFSVHSYSSDWQECSWKWLSANHGVWTFRLPNWVISEVNIVTQVFNYFVCHYGYSATNGENPVTDQIRDPLEAWSSGSFWKPEFGRAIVDTLSICLRASATFAWSIATFAHIDFCSCVGSSRSRDWTASDAWCINGNCVSELVDCKLSHSWWLAVLMDTSQWGFESLRRNRDLWIIMTLSNLSIGESRLSWMLTPDQQDSVQENLTSLQVFLMTRGSSDDVFSWLHRVFLSWLSVHSNAI
jgi:hypothetical protein